MRYELGAQLFEGTNGVGCQPAEPYHYRAPQRGGKGPTLNLVWYPLKVHQGLERLQVIQWVLVSVVIFHLRHTKLWRKGKRVDGHGEWWICSMDQIVEITGNSSLKLVHHAFHPFFHHLHLLDDMGWGCISNGWTTHVLSIRSTRGVITLRPLLVPPVNTGTFLIFLLGSHRRVLLL